MDPNTQIASDQHSLIGKTVAGRYEVVQLIGNGAMGAVYKARHISLGRLFAVKTMHASVKNDAKMLKRFQQEAQAMSVLTHPNIIHIADYGQTDDGDPFLVMEFLEGLSLSDKIKYEGPMGIAQSLPIFAQIADALEHAHKQNLIHRDLKPSNIMLTGENRDFVKVVDFGIAKVVANEEESQHLTATGEVFGSPLYMSPEQCMGTSLDARSDIYSLGCLMYEALSGKPPLKGANFVQTAYKHMNEMPEPLTELRTDMCPDFNALIFSCLSKKPEERPQAMTAVRDRLRELIGMHCTESQQNKALGDSGLTSAIKALPATAAEEKTGMAKYGKAGAIAFIAVVIGVFAVSLTSQPIRQKPPAPPATTPTAIAPTAAPTAPSSDFDTTSTVSIGSPIFSHDDPSAPDEIDAVAIYKAGAATDVVGQASKAANSNVVVKIRPNSKPATLLLFSYEPVHWKVEPYTGGEVGKVIASGYQPQDVGGLINGNSNVTNVCNKNGDADAFDTGRVFNPSTGSVAGNRKQVYEAVDQAVKKLLRNPNAKIKHFVGGFYGQSFTLPPDPGTTDKI